LQLPSIVQGAHPLLCARYWLSSCANDTAGIGACAQIYYIGPTVGETFELHRFITCCGRGMCHREGQNAPKATTAIGRANFKVLEVMLVISFFVYVIFSTLPCLKESQHTLAMWITRELASDSSIHKLRPFCLTSLWKAYQ